MADDVKIKIGGDTSGAEASIKDLEQETKKSFEKMAQTAEEAADDVAKSFKRAGIRTEKEIKESSIKAKRDFERIRDSGVASANDIKRAHNSMTAKLKKNSRELATSSQRISKIFTNIKGTIIAATVAAVGFFGAKVFGEAIRFESALLDLQKVMSDTEGDAKQFTGVTEELAKKFGVSSAEVLQGAANFKQAGFNLQEAFMLQEQALKLVIAGDIEAAEASELLVSTLKGFKAPASEAARLTDVLNEVSNRYATNLQELAIGMAQVSPIAKIMGFTFEETAGLLTPIIEVFRSGSESARGFRTGLLKLLDDSVPVTNALIDLGVAQREGVNKTMRSGKDIVADVAQAFRGLEENQKLVFATQIVGIKQAAKMVQVFDGLSDTLAITNVGMEAHGSINKEVAVRLASTHSRGKTAAQGFSIMAKSIGDLLLPAWNALLDIIIPTLDAITFSIRAISKANSALENIGSVLANPVFAFFGFVKASKKVEDQTHALIKANEEFETSEEKIATQLKAGAEAFEERRKSRQEDAQAASDAAEKELAAVSLSLTVQQEKNKVIKESIRSVKSTLRDLERDLQSAASFTQKILASIAASQKVIAQQGLDPLEKLLDNLDRAQKDFREAVKAEGAGNVEEAQELTLSAVNAANAILEIQKGATAGSEVTTSELSKATRQAEKLVSSALKFSEAMELSAKEAIPSVQEELAGLEADLIDGQDQLATLKGSIKVATADAEKLKAILQQNTTATHTQVINTVNTGGGGANIPGFSTGVKLPGYGGGDKILARLEAGERVIKKEAVRNLEGLGSRAMAALHKGDIRALVASLPLPEFNQGGKVEAPTSRGTTNVNLNLGNKTFPMTTRESVAEEFAKEIKSINIVRSRKFNPY
jgi:TP901 family phage tail tape measure protein